MTQEYQLPAIFIQEHKSRIFRFRFLSPEACKKSSEIRYIFSDNLKWFPSSIPIVLKFRLFDEYLVFSVRFSYTSNPICRMVMVNGAEGRGFLLQLLRHMFSIFSDRVRNHWLNVNKELMCSNKVLNNIEQTRFYFLHKHWPTPFTLELVFSFGMHTNHRIVTHADV